MTLFKPVSTLGNLSHCREFSVPLKTQMLLITVWGLKRSNDLINSQRLCNSKNKSNFFSTVFWTVTDRKGVQCSVQREKNWRLSTAAFKSQLKLVKIQRHSFDWSLITTNFIIKSGGVGRRPLRSWDLNIFDLLCCFQSSIILAAMRLSDAGGLVFPSVNEMTGCITTDCRHCEIITPQFNKSWLSVYAVLVCPGICPPTINSN